MRFVERPEALLMPSRHNLAMFRLVAFVRLAAALRAPSPGGPDRLYFVDRNQSSVENYAVSAWFTLTSALYFFAVVSPRTGATLAAVVALPAMGFLLEWPAFFVGGVLVPLWNAATGRRVENSNGPNSAALMLLMGVVSAWFFRAGGWPRLVAMQFFALCAVNAVVALLMFLMRAQVVRLEAKLGGRPSVP